MEKHREVEKRLQLAVEKEFSRLLFSPPSALVVILKYQKLQSDSVTVWSVVYSQKGAVLKTVT